MLASTTEIVTVNFMARALLLAVEAAVALVAGADAGEGATGRAANSLLRTRYVISREVSESAES